MTMKKKFFVRLARIIGAINKTTLFSSSKFFLYIYYFFINRYRQNQCFDVFWEQVILSRADMIINFYFGGIQCHIK
jgi:hypothetical protein